MRGRVVAAALLATLAGCRTVSPPALDALVTSFAARGNSGAVLVERGGKTIFRKAYGLADRERNIANTVDTRFHVASVAKIFTAAAILKLEEEGRLSTADPISKYLGPFDDGETGATIHHLLTHTSGLVVKGATLDESSRDAFIRSVAATPRAARPGETYTYLNAGYSLLAAIVEIVSGEPFETFVARELFAPAGMSATGFLWQVQPGDRSFAIGYAGKTVAELAPVPRQTEWALRGPGGVVTTVGDLQRWVHALRDDVVLSAASRRKMFTAYFGDEGYGWHVAKTSRGTTVVHRGGGMPEVAAELRWFPDEESLIVILRNEHLDSPTANAKEIEELVFAR
jgi:CubicO group peptidase (beta-lactamase class C family)